MCAQSWKKKLPPHFSHETKKLIYHKNRLHKKWKTSNNILDQLEFKKLRASCKQYILRDYQNYRESVESKITENPSRFFSIFVS